MKFIMNDFLSIYYDFYAKLNYYVVLYVCLFESVSLITRFENSVRCGVFYISSEILKSFHDNFS